MQKNVKNMGMVRPLVFAINMVLCGVSSSIFISTAYADESSPQNYQIAAASLSEVLLKFSVQSGARLTVEQHKLAGLNSAGLSGEYSIESGFAKILESTPYQIKKVNDAYVLIEKPAVKSQTRRDKGQLETIQSAASAEESTNQAQLPVIKMVANQTAMALKKQTQSGALGSKSILDTPFSVTVVDSEDIEKRGAKSVGQIFINDPAVYSHAAAMATNWHGASVRGLLVRNHYIDGLPMELFWGGDYPVEAAESVTVLKGMTGFMYGFGSPGGAISYQLKRPKASPETSVDLSYRNPSMLTFFLDSSNYIDAFDVGYRFVLGGDTGEAYNAAEQSRVVSSLALDKKITENLNWTANFSYENNKIEHEPPIFSLAVVSDVLPKASYEYENLAVDNSYYKTNTFIANTGLDWTINPNWQLKYQLGYTRRKQESNLVFDYLLNSAGDYEGYVYQFAYLAEGLMNQLMLTGKFNTGQIQHELVTGLGYSESSIKDSDYYWADNANYTGNIYENQNYIISRTADYTLGSTSSQTAQSYAFLSDTVKFNDQWQTILGVRHTYYDKEDMDYTSTSNSGYSTKATTPTIALLYKPAPDATIYASYVESLESGSVVDAMYANGGEVLDATISKQYEVGMKYDADVFGLTAAVFKMERAATMDTIRDNLTYLTQDGVTDYNGVELNTTYRPTEQLKLGLGAMYLDASYDKLDESSSSLIGNRPAGVAKWFGVLNAEYILSAIEGLSVHGNMRYNGSSYTTQRNTVKEPAYSLLNLGLSYKFKLAKHDAVVNANLNNVLNKKYWASSATWASLGEAINGVVALKVTW